MNYFAVFGAALASTLCAALSTALKHRSAGQTPQVSFSPRRLGAFLRATVKHPLWLGGVVADLGALAMQVVALHYGPLSVVQPVLASTILFALIFSHFISGVPLSVREGVLGVLLVGAVAAFLWVSGATSAGDPVGPAHHDRAAIAAVVVLVAVGVCLWGAGRVGRSPRGALLGSAVGLLYAVTAVLIKACSDRFQQGPIHLLLSWELYAWVAAGAGALVLAQAAFQRGTLAAVVGGTAAVDPIASVALGIAVYDERLRSNPAAVVGEVLSLALLVWAVIQLARTRAEREGGATRVA